MKIMIIIETRAETIADIFSVVQKLITVLASLFILTFNYCCISWYKSHLIKNYICISNKFYWKTWTLHDLVLLLFYRLY